MLFELFYQRQNKTFKDRYMNFNSWKLQNIVTFFYTALFLSLSTTFAGTGDFVGGGNGSKFKIYESNVERLVKIPSYNNKVKPLLIKFDQLMNKLNQNDSQKAFPYSEFLTKMKLWYFSDDNLNSIDKETLGVIFNKEKTQQIALNKKREIWIDNKIFIKMKEEHQADLLVHEFVMNLYFLKYYSFYEICIIGNEMGLYSKEENQIPCEGFKDVQYFNSKEAMALNEDDYQNIRRVTDWFLNDLKTASTDDLYNKLIYNNFDKRFITKGDTKKEIQLKGDEIEKIIKENFVTDSFPDTCKSTFSNTALNCSATLEKTTSNYTSAFNKLEFTINNGSEIKKIAFNITSEYSTYTSPLQMHQGIPYYSVIFYSNAFPLELTHELGQRLYILTLNFTLKQGVNTSSSELIAYSLTPMTITNLEPINENQTYTTCEIKKLNPQKHPSFYWGQTPQLESLTGISIHLTAFSKSVCNVKTPEQLQKELIQYKRNAEVKRISDLQLQPLIGKTFEFKSTMTKWGKESASLVNTTPQTDYFESRLKSCLSAQKSKECIPAMSLKFLSLNTVLINNQVKCNVYSMDSSNSNGQNTKIHYQTGIKTYFSCQDPKFEVIGLPYGDFNYNNGSLQIRDAVYEYNNHFYRIEFNFSEVMGR